jgi:hypothetical protein
VWPVAIPVREAEFGDAAHQLVGEANFLKVREFLFRRHCGNVQRGRAARKAVCTKIR